METKLDKLIAYQENNHENATEKAKRIKKKSASSGGIEITGYEGQGMIKTSMSDIPKNKWESIFGKKKKNKKTNTGKKVRRYYK